MFDVDLQALGVHLLPVVDFIERAHLSCGNAGLVEFFQQVRGLVMGKGLLDFGDDQVAVAHPVPVRGEFGPAHIEPKGLRELGPQFLTADADLHAADARLE